MTNAELISTNAPRAIQLRALCTQIRAYHESAEIRKKRVQREANDYVSDSALCGKALVAAKATVKKNGWMEWLGENFPEIHYKKAQRYMNIANHWEKVKAIDESESLRAAMMLCYEGKNKGEAEPKTWPVYLEACNRFAKFVKAHPVLEWPSEEQQLLRENIEPVARALWPERFA